MISHFTGGNTLQPPEPVLSRAEWEQMQLNALRSRRHASFVAYCEGLSCGRALYYGDAYGHCGLGTYCQSCWNEIQADMRLEQEAGHDHA